MNQKELWKYCEQLLVAYRNSTLGYMKMPEDENPGFTKQEQESRLTYFTLPMSLNYQRNSYKLREAALQTFLDPETRNVFTIKDSATMDKELLRQKLMRYKVALQPNKHIATRRAIAETIYTNWGSLGKLFEAAEYDFLKLRDIIQKTYKKGFPYLSGPKIFNYRSFVIQEYGKITLKNSEYIEIAPDTHITKCSVILGVITQQEAETLSKEVISQRRREALQGSGITPIQMHPPLWFWSRNNFTFKLH